MSNTGFGRHFIDHVGNLNLSKKMSSPKTTDNYHFYKQDGIVTFLTAIDQLSVFFHRSDSTGEGGSNQLWFKEVLFPLVLSKMRNKGLLITDGSLCGYFDDVFDYYVPWNAMCGEEPYSRPKISTNFKWSNFHFKCVAKISHNTFVWQVENIK